MLFDPGFEPLQLVAIRSSLFHPPLAFGYTLKDGVSLPFPRVDPIVDVYAARLLVQRPGRDGLPLIPRIRGREHAREPGEETDEYEEEEREHLDPVGRR